MPDREIGFIELTGTTRIVFAAGGRMANAGPGSGVVRPNPGKSD